MPPQESSNAPTRRGRLPVQERARREREVLDAAMRVIVDQGPAAATMQAIAEEAHASKETLYSWFGDRDALIAALIRANADASAVELTRSLEPAGDRPCGARATLEGYAGALLTLLTGEVSVALNRAAMTSPALAAELLHSGRHRVGPIAVAYLAELHDRRREPTRRRPGGLLLPLRAGRAGHPDQDAPGRARPQLTGHHRPRPVGRAHLPRGRPPLKVHLTGQPAARRRTERGSICGHAPREDRRAEPTRSACPSGQSHKSDQPLVHIGHAQNGGVVVEDALVPNPANDDDVLEFTALRPGKSGSKFDEHPSPVMVGGNHQHSVSCQHGL